MLIAHDILAVSKCWQEQVILLEAVLQLLACGEGECQKLELELAVAVEEIC
jgi:hypothetical protein